jgi:pimeloyl-ACP methyl ester carboxylesterase
MVPMPTFCAADGLDLAYHVLGDGNTLVCLPGGPMRASAYLGDLGGLSARRRLVRLDLRGTGQSASAADPAAYRCDRLVDDVAALADHLGHDRVDLLGHSAGASLAVLFAARYPQRVSKLVLITPSTRAVGLEITGDIRREVVELRRDEPWFAGAAAAFDRIDAGEGTDDDWDAVLPFFYGRWDAAAQAHAAAGEDQQNEDAASAFNAEGAFDPAATRAAVAAFSSPVLLLAGELDLGAIPRVAAEFAGLFPNAELVVQPGAGHYPWLDDGDWFVSATAGFLDADAAHGLDHAG